MRGTAPKRIAKLENQAPSQVARLGAYRFRKLRDT